MEKRKILLPSKRTVTSGDVDLYLNIDLNQSFFEIKRNRYDNDFDLNSNFIKERNISRNFFVYGEIQSVATDCDSLLIRAYSDENMTQLYSSTSTSKIGFGPKNVFGKRNGKYFFELNDYPYDAIYFKILSDRFSYRDHTWGQRLVFYDSDQNIVPYGSTLVDVNYDGQETIIENDFPFFFNKHWVRNDTIIVEEKKARISFDSSYYEVQEGSSGEIIVTLDKDSPFGIESATIDDITAASTSNTSSGDLEFIDYPISAQLPNYGPLSIQSTGTFFSSTNQPYENKLTVFVRLNGQNESNINRGNSFSLSNSDYDGTYEILYSSSLPSTLSGVYIIVLNTEFNNSNNNSSIASFSSGSQPDIKFYFNNSEVQFPINMSWSEGERNKSILFNVNEDSENELKERLRLSISQTENLRNGQNMTAEVRINDTTERRLVKINLGPVFQNRYVFTGRTYTDENGEVAKIDSYSILRNGLYFEGRNEEFYPVDEFEIRIKNLGQRTIFPANPDLSVFNESVFNPGEERLFNVRAKYTSQLLNSILIKLPEVTINSPEENIEYLDGSDSVKYYINGVLVTPQWRGYYGLRMSINGGPSDYYNQSSIKKDFEVLLDDVNRTITLTSKSPGTRIDFSTNDPEVEIETITEYQYAEQIPVSINLFANLLSNTKASYLIEFKKQGYSTVTINDTNIPNLYSEISELSLVTGYSNIMRPFIDSVQEVYTYSSSTIDENSIYTISEIEESQPTYMPVGNAYINGLLFLSNALTPNRRENLTTLSFAEITDPIQPIQNTFEDLVSVSTRKVVRMQILPIEDMEMRQFSFQFGNELNSIFYRFIIIDRDMSYWWSNGTGMITLDIDQNALSSASLQQRLDIGISSDQPGPVFGELLNSTDLLMSSKTQGIPFDIFNIVDDYDSIRSLVLCENMVVGSENIANNKMGGFSVIL